MSGINALLPVGVPLGTIISGSEDRGQKTETVNSPRKTEVK